MKHKILITGGAGFIGAALTNYLYNKGYSVVVLDNLSEQIHGADFQESYTYQSILGKCKFINGDVKNSKDWEKALVDIDTVVHLASETGTGQSMYQTQKYTEVNCLGTSILSDFLVSGKHSIKNVIFASSRSLYGEGKYKDEKGSFYYPTERSQDLLDREEFDFFNETEQLTPVATDEESKISPASVYALTKYYQEQLLSITCQSKNINYKALRFQNVYGPGQSLKNPYTGIISIFSNRLRKNEDIFIFEDGKESRDFVYIDDIIKAIFLSIENTKDENLVLNVGSGIATTVLELAEILKKEISSSSEIKITGQYRLGDIRHNFADLSQIKAKLNFSPSVSLSEGIHNFVKWLHSQEEVTDGYEKSLAKLAQKGLLK